MTDEQRCATCRWWEKQEDDLPGPIGNCLLLSNGRGGLSLGRLAYVGCEGDGAFRTFPDFGCVQWEAKP